jgi:DNA-binding CsgD family transcriptional regulator
LQQKKIELRDIVHRCHESPQAAAKEHSSQEENRYLPERLLVMTPRELEICLCVHRGLSSKEIASKIGITLSSVETHRRNIRRKLGIGRKNLAVHLLMLLGR